MAKVKGGLNPENATESSGGRFQEGMVLVNDAAFKVHQNNAPKGSTDTVLPVVALVLNVTRLDDNLEPMTDGDGEKMCEDLVFSLGGKSLSKCTPATADNPDDEEVTSAGDEVGAEGPTFDVHAGNWFPDKKSSVIHFIDSLIQKGFKKEIVDRVWAPDYVGMVAHIISVPGGDMGDAPGSTNRRTWSYKVVDKIVKYPYEAAKGGGKKSGSTSASVAPAAKKSGAGAAASSATEEATSGGNVHDTVLKAVKKVAAEADGETLSAKTFRVKVTEKLRDAKISPSEILEHTKVLKDPAFIEKAATHADFTVNDEGDYVFE